jgi:DNA primase
MVGMARGRIPDSDIAAIRERTPIEEVVGEYVQLTPGGVDSLKGLSPFKDEKTPSFHVRPNKGYFHCFATGEGGDVFSFLMKMEHVTFPEAVEECAERIGYQINYTGGGPVNRVEPGTRQRLIAANRAAQEFYRAQFTDTGNTDPGAEKARDLLRDRGFDDDLVAEFGCGYAPAGWDTLTKHLLRKGFDFKELEAAGLSRMGNRGPIDRFHRRLLWPIRNSAGDVIGFGARKLFDDDKLGKYMNTPETLLYKKSKVLFGLDRAKKSIGADHQAVIVEGYTDVMALHAAGVHTAVAACGTAFGEEHLQMLRRFMLDDQFFRGEIIYTFDGDEAGQKAAMRAFEGDQKFTGRSYVAVAPDGMDPCDLRMDRGDAAVREMVADRIPMFEFVIRTIIGGYDTHHIDGRVDAMRRVVPVLAGIRDDALRDEYARQAAGWLSWPDPGEVVAQVRQEARRAGRRSSGPALKEGVARLARRAEEKEREAAAAQAQQSNLTRPDPDDGYLQPVREVLKLMLQEPQLVGADADGLLTDSFEHPTYMAVAEAVQKAGGVGSVGASGDGGHTPGADWLDAVTAATGDVMCRAVISELAVEEPRCEADRLPFYADAVVARMEERWVGAEIAELKARMQRMRPDRGGAEKKEYNATFADLMALEKYRRTLQDRAQDYGELAD